MTTRKVIGIGGIVVAILVLMFACGIVKVEGPVRGQVIDAETKTPIPGTAVVFYQGADCPRLFHGVRNYPYPRLETQTDRDGRFQIGGGIKFVPYCPIPIWRESLEMLAPGYFVKIISFNQIFTHGANPVRAGVFEMDRIQYLIELEEYRRFSKGRQEKEDKTLWGDVKKVSQRLPYRQLGKPGVFATKPGAIFDQIVAIEAWSWDVPRLSRWSVFTQDRSTGSVYRWMRTGKPEPVHALPVLGASMLGGHFYKGTAYPFFTQENRIYYPYIREVNHSGHVEVDWLFGTSQFARIRLATDSGGYLITVEDRELVMYEWVTSRMGEPHRPPALAPGRRVMVSDLLDGGQPPIECISGVMGLDRQIYLALITHTADGRAMFILPFRWLSSKDGVARRIELPRGTLDTEVTACAGGFRSLYVALKGRGILKIDGYDEPGSKKLTRVTRTPTIPGPDGPINFTSLVVAEFDPFWQMLYAVAGDDKIYRFDANLRPDQRIEFDLQSASSDNPIH